MTEKKEIRDSLLFQSLYYSDCFSSDVLNKVYHEQRVQKEQWSSNETACRSSSSETTW